MEFIFSKVVSDAIYVRLLFYQSSNKSLYIYILSANEMFFSRGAFYDARGCLLGARLGVKENEREFEAFLSSSSFVRMDFPLIRYFVETLKLSCVVR